MRALHWLLAFTLLSSAAACTGTVGPYVADIVELPDGRLSVVRCSTEVTHTGQVVTYDNERGCTVKTIGRPLPTQMPAASTVPSAEAPPRVSSAKCADKPR